MTEEPVGGWTGFWSSRGRAICAGVVISLVLASTLYAFDWYAFYSTRALDARARAESIAADVALLAEATAGRSDSDAALAGLVDALLASRHALVTVTASRGERTVWTETNAVELDERRSLVENAFELSPTGRDGLLLTVGVRERIRPPFLVSLARAWSWSSTDYALDAEQWWARRLYNRSLPLYGYWLVLLGATLPGVLALHRRQLELRRVSSEARRVGRELAALRDGHVEQVRAIEERIARAESERDTARRERERLADEIAEVETRYDGSSGAGTDSLGMTATLERLDLIAARKGEVEEALQQHDSQIDALGTQLSSTRGELTAAEELLEELEQRGGSLASKLRDRNREIRRLQGLLQRARDVTTTLSRSSLQLSRSSRDALLDASAQLETQLSRWLESSGRAKVSFSEHSRAVKVRQKFGLIDRDFVDRYFTHVVNPEYERGARRTIRVKAIEGDEPTAHAGELIVVLDDDAGRTLGLRFALRKNAPDASHVGFVLALLLRARCREFRRYAIRLR